MFKRIIFLLFPILLSVSTLATHLMGGTLSYKYVSSTANDVTYKINIELYRDCRDGVSQTVQFEPELTIGVYHNNTNKSKYKTERIKLISKRLVNISECYTTNYCAEEGSYEGIIVLSKSTLGYYLLNQICCRPMLDNLKNKDSKPENGFSLLTTIPPTSIINNSPVFSSSPNFIGGINKINEDMWNARDKDGDSLVYNIVAPYKGDTTNINGWVPPTNFVNPVSVDYVSGYSFTQPFGSNGSISINQATGQITFSNVQTGEYAFCIEVKEYRKGVLLARHRRDYPLIFINTPPETGFQIKLWHPQFVNNKSVSLSWQSCPNIYPAFTIERKEKFNNWIPIGQSKIKDNFIDTINNNTMYYYRVKTLVNSIEYSSNIDSAYISLTSLKQYQSTQTAIYPNPSKTYLIIHAPSLVGYSIYDITGKMLLQSMELSNAGETKLDIRSLNPGIYFIALKTEKGIITQRFIKE